MRYPIILGAGVLAALALATAPVQSHGDYLGVKTDGVRATAAAGMRAVGETAGQLLDEGGASRRRAEQFLQDTKEHLSEAIRSGEQVVDPTATSKGA